MSVKESSVVVLVVAALGHLPGAKQDLLVMQLVPPAQGRMVTCLHSQQKHDCKQMNIATRQHNIIFRKNKV